MAELWDTDLDRRHIDPDRLSCGVTRWDGPYSFPCSLTLINGTCRIHGRQTDRLARAALEDTDIDMLAHLNKTELLWSTPMAADDDVTEEDVMHAILDGEPMIAWYVEALDAAHTRIEQLEAWKAEGLEVLGEWDQVFDMVPQRTEHLALTRASVVKAHIEQLEPLLKDAGAIIDRLVAENTTLSDYEHAMWLACGHLRRGEPTDALYVLRMALGSPVDDMVLPALEDTE